jgi:hypothetical protein
MNFWLFPVSIASLLFGTFAGYVFIFVFGIPQYAFMLSYAVKFLTEIIVYSILLLYHSNVVFINLNFLEIENNKPIPFKAYLRHLKYPFSILATSAIYILVHNTSIEIIYIFVLGFPRQILSLSINANYILILSLSKCYCVIFISPTKSI